MFETSVVKSEAAVAPRRTGLLAMSLALHSGVIVAIVAVSIAAVEFPTDAPAQFARLVLAAPVSLPPALGRPDGGAKAATPAAPKRQAAPLVPTQPTAPNTVPDTTTPVTDPGTAAEPAITGDGDGTGTHEGSQGQPDGQKGSIGTVGDPNALAIGDGPATPVEENTIYRVGADVTSARVLQRVMPVYPPIMVRNKIPATVSVKCIIDRNGRVRDVEIVRSSFPPFNAAVIAALQQWTFTPGTLRGTPVDTYFELTANFGVQ